MPFRKKKDDPIEIAAAALAIGLDEWQRERKDLDEPAYIRRGLYTPITSLTPEEARARLERIGMPEPLAFVNGKVPVDDMVSLEPIEELPTTVRWLAGAPTQTGAYWVRGGDGTLGMAVVKLMGSHLCAQVRSAHSVVYKNVSILRYIWAGPVDLPSDVTLDEIESRLT